jgi:hypothetical protein
MWLHLARPFKDRAARGAPACRGRWGDGAGRSTASATGTTPGRPPGGRREGGCGVYRRQFGMPYNVRGTRRFCRGLQISMQALQGTCTLPRTSSAPIAPHCARRSSSPLRRPEGGTSSSPRASKNWRAMGLRSIMCRGSGPSSRRIMARWAASDSHSSLCCSREAVSSRARHRQGATSRSSSPEGRDRPCAAATAASRSMP